MPDPQSLAKGLMTDGPFMRAYEPSWRDRMAAALMGDGRASPARAQVVMGLMGSRGLGPTGLSAVDATPAGAVLDMQQAAQHGDKAGMAMAAAGMVPGVKVAEKVAAKVAEAAPAASKGIIAYHGSPHSFDRFDMSKIGTGEGAQAYGHGLYFADKEDVARGYRDALAKHTVAIDGRRVAPKEGSPEELARQYYDDAVRLKSSDPMSSAISRMMMARQNNKNADMFVAAEQALRDWDAMGATPDTLGSMYQVRINADPEQFLDWDKPLANQSPVFQKVLGDYPNEIAGARLKRAYNNEMYAGDIVGADRAKPNELSRHLAAQGIPGIKYLDQGSRGAGEGSRNYVVFDDKIIEIMRKYGLAGSAGAAMAAEILQRQNGGQPQGQAVAPAM